MSTYISYSVSLSPCLCLSVCLAVFLSLSLFFSLSLSLSFFSFLSLSLSLLSFFFSFHLPVDGEKPFRLTKISQTYHDFGQNNPLIYGLKRKPISPHTAPSRKFLEWIFSVDTPFYPGYILANSHRKIVLIRDLYPSIRWKLNMKQNMWMYSVAVVLHHKEQYFCEGYSTLSNSSEHFPNFACLGQQWGGRPDTWHTQQQTFYMIYCHLLR